MLIDLLKCRCCLVTSWRQLTSRSFDCYCLPKTLNLYAAEQVLLDEKLTAAGKPLVAMGTL